MVYYCIRICLVNMTLIYSGLVWYSIADASHLVALYGCSCERHQLLAQNALEVAGDSSSLPFETSADMSHKGARK